MQPTTCRPPEIEAEIYEIDELVAQLLARSRLDLTALSDAPVELGELARRAGERAGVPAEKVVEGGPHALRGGASMGPVMPLSREASDGAPVA